VCSLTVQYFEFTSVEKKTFKKTSNSKWEENVCVEVTIVHNKEKKNTQQDDKWAIHDAAERWRSACWESSVVRNTFFFGTLNSTHRAKHSTRIELFFGVNVILDIVMQSRLLFMPNSLDYVILLPKYREKNPQKSLSCGVYKVFAKCRRTIRQGVGRSLRLLWFVYYFRYGLLFLFRILWNSCCK
jgi:hypothetical protein